MIKEVVGTFVGRWYVTTFGLVFLVTALRELGAKRTAVYTAIAMLVGATAENGSVLVGFPYTRYSFNPALRGHELWVGDVPLMVPMSYTFMAYFAFAAARLVVSGPHVTRGRQPVLEYTLAVVLATWALWILDPVQRLGRYHVVGELFQYAGPGFWFGLPLGSQAGFFCTAGILVGVLSVTVRTEPANAVPRLLRHPRLPGLLTYLGEVMFGVGTALVVSSRAGGQTAATADALSGAALIIAIPMVLVIAVYWRTLPRPASAERPESDSIAPAVGYSERE